MAPHSIASRLLVSTSVVALLVLLALASAPVSRATETIPLPFPGGQAVRIIQGYNGGTHQGRSYYGLDLVLAGGGTSGAQVVSPVDGTIAWAFPPGSGNGCMAVAFNSGSHSVVLCHVIFDRVYRYGERIASGQTLGSVGPPGTVGNNGTPHVHMELHRGGQGNRPTPFAGPEGLPLEGHNLVGGGSYNQHASATAFTSSNGSGSAPAMAPVAAVAPPELDPEPAPAPAPVRQAPRVESAPVTSATVGSEPLAAVSASTSIGIVGRAALVVGTDSCLKVREEPSVESVILDCLPDGAEVSLTANTERDETFEWRQLDDLGWVVTDYLQRTQAVVYGTDACLNVRQQPSFEALVVDCVPDGMAVALSGETRTVDGYDWVSVVETATTDAGWALDGYLD